MRDIPIIFSAPMVIALLDGRKTMTRRLKFGKPRPGRDKPLSNWVKVKPGDRLWVRENLTCVGDGIWRYAAGDMLQCPLIYRQKLVDWSRKETRGIVPSIHMPRWASRLTLTVTATKIEPVASISEDDARAEGWKRRDDLSSDPEVHRDAARDWFSDLWDSLHGVESWRANPEVVAMTFTVKKSNIDVLSKVEAA